MAAAFLLPPPYKAHPTPHKSSLTLRSRRARALLMLAAAASLSLIPLVWWEPKLAKELAKSSLGLPRRQAPTVPLQSGCDHSPRSWMPRSMADRWIIRGKSYNLHPFIHKHPGGWRYLANTVNTDVTELFESMHIGTTAAATLEQFLDEDLPQLASDWRETNERYRALKRDIKANFDLNDLKNPSTEYLTVYAGTVAVYGAALAGCLTASSPAVAWGSHTVLGLSIAWVGGFAHNGLHMWTRRPVETLGMYLSLSNNPFRWMYIHLTSHHMHTNTALDNDKRAVAEFRAWWQQPLVGKLKWVLGCTFGTFWVGMQTALVREAGTVGTAPSMSVAEHRLPVALFSIVNALGVSRRGWRWVPRVALSFALSSIYSFIFFQVSHLQPSTIDGDTIRREASDWGEFQLRTTNGWGALHSPLRSAPWLFLNLQPAHHLFPAIHHSKLCLITPLIRSHYPSLMEDHDIFAMTAAMFRTLTAIDDPSLPRQRCLRGTDCGFRDITIQQCEERGCIYDPCGESAAGCTVGPWCHRPRPRNSTMSSR